MMKKCNHCRRKAVSNPCLECRRLLAELGWEDDKPAPGPRTRRPYEPSPEDQAAYRELFTRRR